MAMVMFVLIGMLAALTVGLVVLVIESEARANQHDHQPKGIKS